MNKAVLAIIIMVLLVPVVDAKPCKNVDKHDKCAVVNYLTSDQVNIQWCVFGANGVWACRGTLVGDTSGVIYWFRPETIILPNKQVIQVYYRL